MDIIERKTMRYKILLVVLVTGILTMSTIGCGVPKSEHEKIVQELEKANQEKTALSDQINQLKAEKESLSQKYSQLEKELNTLRQENEDLKARLTAKKPAVQPKPKKR